MRAGPFGIPRLGLILLLCLLPGAVRGEGPVGRTRLPLPARLVLAKVDPMVRNSRCDEAIQTLQAFQDQGGPAPAPNDPDPKGYHHPEIYVALGRCHLLQESPAPAAEAFRRALARDPSHIRAWLSLAKAAFEMNAYGEAAQAFARGYAFSGKKAPEHLYYAAAAYLRADDPVRAVEAFEQLMADHSKAVLPEWKEHYVHALLAADRPRQALPVIQELARRYTGDRKTRWQETLLYFYLEFGMTAEGMNLARVLTRENPAEPKWWKARAHLQLNADRIEAALVSFTIYSYLTPLTREERRLMADLSLQVGIPAQAVPLYETDFREKPNRDLLRHLVHGYRQLGEPEKALARLEGFDGTAGDPALLMLKGELLYSLNRYDAAAEVFRRAAAMDHSRKGRAWLMAGYSAWQQNDLPAGREAFLQAARHAPEKKAAAEALRQLEQMAGG